MSNIVVILDDTPASQKLGVAMLGSIGEIVSAVKFMTVTELPAIAAPDTIYCPLTLDTPATFKFWGQSIGQTCQDLDLIRELVTAKTGIKSAPDGNLWLPVIWTARGPIYGEVIGQQSDHNYEQPIHFDDLDRQPLYQLGYQLLTELAAPPATYLIQFSKQAREIIFDRLFPFPAMPAIASIGVQHPDLFECHWRCITGQSITNLYVE
jgi:hypothetical protein